MLRLDYRFEIRLWFRLDQYLSVYNWIQIIFLVLIENYIRLIDQIEFDLKLLYKYRFF